VVYGGELNQVWTDLIESVVDALRGKGEITIRTKVIGEFVQVDIGDNRPGIPEEIQIRVLDPFFTT